MRAVWLPVLLLATRLHTTAGGVGDAMLAAGFRGALDAPLRPAAAPAPSPPAARAPLRVMIDPGHGGSNLGAAGVVEGLYEKRLTLELARETAARLAASGFVVELTRDDDRFLSLRERVRRANQAGVDVFLSIHANASTARAQRGFETYILTPEAVDVDAEAIRGGDAPARAGVDPATCALLDEIERAAAVPAAARLAERIQARLAEVRPPQGNRGVKQAAMDVLMGPLMPAVLVEVGFIDHPVEGTELLRRETREAIAAALARALADYRDLAGVR
jgi:N-acetylmuramoyl-L-alanine amidase